MVVDLRKIEDSAIEFDVRIEPSDVDIGARFAQLEKPSDFSGEVRREGWITYVSGSFEAELERRCDRCYRKALLTLPVNVDAAYVVFSALSDEREAELDILGLDYLVLERYELDLKKVFAEQLLLAMPDKFVCEAGCSGICPECGRPKETGECVCKEESTDPRWAALKDIKKNL